MLVEVDGGEVAEEGCSLTNSNLVATDVGVSAIEKEMSSATIEGGEVGRVSSEVVVESKII